MAVPIVSVVLVSWNSADYVSRCMDALDGQNFKDFEVVAVDNGSDDNSISIFASRVFQTRVERLERNCGFAAANNIGARLANGEWLAFLNVDAFPEPDWLEKLLKAAEANSECSLFSSHQLQANSPEFLDGAGDAYHVSGLAWRNGYNHPVVRFGQKQNEVFSACAAAALYRREEFLEAGGFDEDYFSYFEDVDLGFRLRLTGKKCLYVPDAVVHHVGSASTGKRSDFSVYYGYRNMIWTYFKNMPFPLFWLFLPVHIGTVLFFMLYLTWRGQGRVILRAVSDALHGLPKMLVKRRNIQSNIKINPFNLLKVMSVGLIEPYREFLNRNYSR